MKTLLLGVGGLALLASCPPIPPISELDRCPNIEGIQLDVPEGMEIVNGECVPLPPPPLECPEGTQPWPETLPTECAPTPICEGSLVCACNAKQPGGAWVHITCPQPTPTPTPVPTPTPTPEPTPTPTPAACFPEVCPPLRMVGLYFFHPWAPANESLTVDAGTNVVMDMTPRFSAPGCVGRGCACNAEKFNCITEACWAEQGEAARTAANSRPCEDPRGGVWSTNHPGGGQGGVNFEFFTLKNVKRGTWWIQVCPVPNYTDQLGVPVPVQGNACMRKTLVVR